MPSARPAALAFLLAAVSAHAADLAADYQAGVAGNAVPSPAASGWTAGTPTSDVANFLSAAVPSDGSSGLNAWRMLDNSAATSQFLTWNRSFSAAQHAAAAANGWRMATRMRMLDPVAGNASGTSVVLLYGNNAAKRWVLFFDINAFGSLVVTLTGGPSITLTGVDPSLYHEHQLVYDPVSATADYFVDGVLKTSGYSGTTGAFNGVQWGTGSAGNRGDSYWNSVSFLINDPPPPPRPLVTTHPISRSTPAGTDVTLTAAFSGLVSSWQWLHNTVALPDSNAPTLTLPAVSAANTGDYWCMATNVSGTTSTNSASLEILDPAASLRITEFMAENDSGLRDEDGQQSDWIELHNPSTNPLSTAGWSLTDNPALPRKWPLPDATIAPGGFLHIWASGKNRSPANGPYHASFALSNAANSYLALVNPDGQPVTLFTYPEQFADQSGGLATGSASGFRYFAVPSPGALNTDAQSSVKDGISLDFPAVFSTSLSIPPPAAIPGATARYSLDGSLPDFASPPFTSPLSISTSTNLRVAYLFPSERFGATASRSAIKLAPDTQSFSSPLPVVILSNHGAGAVPGVSARGPNGDGSSVTAVPHQPHSLAILDDPLAATTMASPATARSRAGLKVRGSSSFTFAEKSYSLETWGERDNSERDLPLADLPADADWVLYGPDPAQFDNTLIHNSVAYELARRSGFPAPRFRFVELFLDSGGDLTMADHRGLAILTEKPSRGKHRIDFNYLNGSGTTGGWLLSVDRMDAATATVPIPRHFHTAGPDRLLQTPDDNPRGFQAIQSPGGNGAGAGITPASDDQPNYYHSFFNFVSPAPASLSTSQRSVIQNDLRRFDAALYSPSFTDPVTGYAPLIDVPNWARHLIIHTFTKNQDAVVLSSFLYREKSGSPLRWASVWDFDRAFDRNTSSGTTGNVALTWAHDRLFYRRLVTDPEFMQAYTDEWQRLRLTAWTDAALADVVDSQAAAITPIVAARSGLTASTWSANLATMKSWMLARATAMDAQFVRPPALSHPGGPVPAGFSLSLSTPAGTIFFTTDGSDPRLRGGSPSPTASSPSGPLAISSPTTIIARSRNGTAWSGPVSASFIPPQDVSALRLTEIHYHPEDQLDPFLDSAEFEFLELKNTGSSPIDATGLSFSSGITFAFPPATVIPPGAFFVIARNPVAFSLRFPAITPNGDFTDKLANSGESLTLSLAGSPVWSVSYSDSPPWRPEADGRGLSLQRPIPTAPGSDPLTWTAATPSPGRDLDTSDADADGLPDYWESLNGFSLTSPDGPDDRDSDGASNLSEFLSGTDPSDPLDSFTLTPAPSGTSFSFRALAGRTYQLQESPDLQSWSVTRRFPASPDSRTESIPLPTSPTPRYWRIATP